MIGTHDPVSDYVCSLKTPCEGHVQYGTKLFEDVLKGTMGTTSWEWGAGGKEKTSSFTAEEART